jgi:antirestriction protein ArdC
MVYQRAKKELTERRDPIQETADTIIAALEKGVKPWQRPWDQSKCVGTGSPFNPITKHSYRGVNHLLLSVHMAMFGSDDPRYMTYQQAREAGYQVKKGAKSTTIFFTKPYEVEDAKAEDGTKTIHFMKHFAVFPAALIEGVPPYQPPTIEEAPWSRPEAGDIILRNSGATIRTGGDQAFYSPVSDHIQLPPDHAFRSPAHLFATAMHELCHWTGHSSRLDRNLSKKFGSVAYAMEELRAELASVFIGGQMGIPTVIPNHASYVANWLKPLKDDKREIFRAAADAQRAADMILGFHPDYAAQRETYPERPVAKTERQKIVEPSV